MSNTACRPMRRKLKHTFGVKICFEYPDIIYIYYRPYRQMLFEPCRLGLNYKPLLSRHNLEYMRYYNVLHHVHLFIFAV